MNARDTQRARALAEGIAGRLFNDGALDLSDGELERVLAPCSGGNNLVTAAQWLRDVGMLTLAAEWINKRHRHASDPGAVCHCDTPMREDQLPKRAAYFRCRKCGGELAADEFAEGARLCFDCAFEVK